jgi:hypothetical protein
MVKDISAPLHAAQVLLSLPMQEYHPALRVMAGYMQLWTTDKQLPADQVEAARLTLRALRNRLLN